MSLDFFLNTINTYQPQIMFFGGILVAIFLIIFIWPKKEKLTPNSNQYTAYLSLLQLITDLSLVLVNKKDNVVALPEKLQKTRQELILYASPKIIQMFNDYIANLGGSNQTVNPYIYFQNMNVLIKQLRVELGADTTALQNIEYIEFLTGVDLKSLKIYAKK